MHTRGASESISILDSLFLSSEGIPEKRSLEVNRLGSAAAAPHQLWRMGDEREAGSRRTRAHIIHRCRAAGKIYAFSGDKWLFTACGARAVAYIYTYGEREREREKWEKNPLTGVSQGTRRKRVCEDGREEGEEASGERSGWTHYWVFYLQLSNVFIVVSVCRVFTWGVAWKKRFTYRKFWQWIDGTERQMCVKFVFVPKTYIHIP